MFDETENEVVHLSKHLGIHLDQEIMKVSRRQLAHNCSQGSIFIHNSPKFAPLTFILTDDGIILWNNLSTTLLRSDFMGCLIAYKCYRNIDPSKKSRQKNCKHTALLILETSLSKVKYTLMKLEAGQTIELWDMNGSSWAFTLSGGDRFVIKLPTVIKIFAMPKIF